VAFVRYFENTCVDGRNNEESGILQGTHGFSSYPRKRVSSELSGEETLDSRLRGNDNRGTCANKAHSNFILWGERKLMPHFVVRSIIGLTRAVSRKLPRQDARAKRGFAGIVKFALAVAEHAKVAEVIQQFVMGQ